jgi:hypothetical protein
MMLAGPIAAVTIRSGSRTLTASMLTGAEELAMSPKTFSPPARSTSSLRKLPRPSVIGGCSQTRIRTRGLRSRRPAVPAAASAVSNAALMESASGT